jgi:hypothetical protein
VKLSQIKKASAAIEGGSWVKSPIFPGVRHRVKGMSCRDAQALRTKRISEIPRAERIGGLSKAHEDEIELHILSEVIWLDSEGLCDDDDRPIVLSLERRRELLANPDLSLLRNDVIAASTRAGEVELAEAELDAKN